MTTFLEVFAGTRTDTFTHEGREYSLPELKRRVAHCPIVSVQVRDLVWIFRYDDPNTDHPERVATADVHQPIIVTRTRDGWVVLDGLHRLKRAVDAHMRVLPARIANENDLHGSRLR